ARSKLITNRRLPLSTAWVRKTRLPQTMGLELPPSGKGVFQRTFSVALQWRGSFFSRETPSPVGPRKPGQLVADIGPRIATSIATAGRNRTISPPANCQPTWVATGLIV